jgi:hypothetical protein
MRTWQMYRHHHQKSARLRDPNKLPHHHHKHNIHHLIRLEDHLHLALHLEDDEAILGNVVIFHPEL